MPAKAAIETVGESLLTAAKTLWSVVGRTRDDSVASDASDEAQDLVLDLSRQGFHRGKLDDLSTWLPDSERVPAMWGSKSSDRQVHMAACSNAVRAAVGTYDEVLLNSHLPVNLVAFLVDQRDALLSMDLRLRASISVPA